MTIKTRFPQPVDDIPIRFFGRFTGPDLARIGLPLGLAYLAAATLHLSTKWIITALGIGAIGSAVWYSVRPNSEPLDQLAYHAFRWMAVTYNTGVSADDTENDQQSLIKAIGDDHAVTADGTYVAAIQVHPTNLSMKTEREQAALQSVLHEDVLETITYPIQLHSRQLPLSLDAYRKTLGANDDMDPDLTADLHARVASYETTEAYRTLHYVVVRNEPDTAAFLQTLLGDDAATEQRNEVRRRELDARCDELIDALTTTELDADRITGPQLQVLMKSFDVAAADLQPCHYEVDGGRKISPYRKLAYINEFPTTLPLAWPTRFFTADGRIDLIQTIQPRNQGRAAKKLERTLQRLHTERESLIRTGFFGTNKIDSAIEDAKWMLDKLADRDDIIVDYGAYIVAHGDTMAECEATFDHITQRLPQAELREPIFRTDHALHTESALTHDPLDRTTMVPGSAAASGFPFATTRRQTTGGPIYGTDTHDGTPVILDRFNWKAGHLVRMGASGSGKSYATKVELLRAALAYDDLQIYVIDPMDEYTELAKVLGGQVIPIHDALVDELPESEVTLLSSDGELVTRGQLADAVELVHEAIDDETPTLAVIDEANQLMNWEEDRGRTALSNFVRLARHKATAVTLISQCASDFTDYSEGQAILDNAPAKVFMQHESVSDAIQDHVRLSDRELTEILTLATGNEHDYSEAILKVSNRIDTKLRIEGTDTEHRLITGERRQ